MSQGRETMAETTGTTPRWYGADERVYLEGQSPGERDLVAATPTLGALLRVAVEEADRVVGSEPSTRLDGRHWQEVDGTDPGLCACCLAGAMLRRLGVGAGHTIRGFAGSETGRAVRARLYAVDWLRRGEVEQAARHLYGAGDRGDRAAAFYGIGPVAEEADRHRSLEPWPEARGAYLRLADALEERGI